jgi:hypothetical protein
LGKWKNVGWWQLQLNEYGDEPKPPILFRDLRKDFLPELFQQVEKLINEK